VEVRTFSLPRIRSWCMSMTHDPQHCFLTKFAWHNVVGTERPLSRASRPSCEGMPSSRGQRTTRWLNPSSESRSGRTWVKAKCRHLDWEGRRAGSDRDLMLQMAWALLFMHAQSVIKTFDGLPVWTVGQACLTFATLHAHYSSRAHAILHMRLWVLQHTASFDAVRACKDCTCSHGSKWRVRWLKSQLTDSRQIDALQALKAVGISEVVLAVDGYSMEVSTTTAHCSCAIVAVWQCIYFVFS